MATFEVTIELPGIPPEIIRDRVVFMDGEVRGNSLPASQKIEAFVRAEQKRLKKYGGKVSYREVKVASK